MPGAWLARPSGSASSTMIRAISILLAEQRPLGPGRIDAPEDLVPDLRGVCGVRADGREVVQRGAECNRVGPTLRLGPGHQATGGVQQKECAAFRTRLPDRCATAGGTVATATSACLGPTILFSTANVTNANLIALSEK
jgi:hypothetical protein